MQAFPPVMKLWARSSLTGTAKTKAGNVLSQQHWAEHFSSRISHLLHIKNVLFSYKNSDSWQKKKKVGEEMGGWF